MLKGKLAIITGSTSGIGLGIATALARKGANIMLNGLGLADEIENTRAALEKETGVKVVFNDADMSKGNEIVDMINQAKQVFGRVDILVNNAGIQHVAPIDEFPVEKWEEIIQINLIAAFHSLRAALPIMKAQGWGRIINIASAHALVASPFKSAYVAAKHGIAGFNKNGRTRSCAEKYHCKCNLPWICRTQLVENQIKDQAKAHGISEQDIVNNVILGAQPTKQFTTVEQIGGLAVFLCSDAAANMTGGLIPIDGGWTAQ